MRNGITAIAARNLILRFAPDDSKSVLPSAKTRAGRSARKIHRPANRAGLRDAAA